MRNPKNLNKRQQISKKSPSQNLEMETYDVYEVNFKTQYLYLYSLLTIA